MFGNFYEANRQNSGSQLDVRGWLVWETGDTSADLTIAVSQGPTSGTAPTQTVTPQTHPSTPTNPAKWQATVPAANGSPFVQGDGAGLAGTIIHNGNSSQNKSWTKNPLIVK